MVNDFPNDIDMTGVLFVDEPDDDVPVLPKPRSPARSRRRSFIEAEKKLKELSMKPSRIVILDEATVNARRRRYSGVTSRKIPPNSLLDTKTVRNFFHFLNSFLRLISF